MTLKETTLKGHSYNAYAPKPMWQNLIYPPPVCPCSLPAPLCDAAPSAAADPAEASGGAAEGPLPLSQHKAGQ